MNFTQNPYCQFHPLTSKEGMLLYRSATDNWSSPLNEQDLINLRPEDAQKFVDTLSGEAKKFGYELLLKRVPLTKVTEADGTITFGEHTDILKTWNKVTPAIAQKNATETWGDKSWTETDNKEIGELAEARLEVIAGSTAIGDPTLNRLGKALFKKRQCSKCLAHHCLGLLSKKTKASIMLHEKEFEWFDTDSGESGYDGLTILLFILQRLRPNYIVDVFKELEKIKKISLADYKGNLCEWLDAMDEKKTIISLKDRDAYTDRAYTKDLLDGMLEAKCTSFKTEILRMKMRWMNGNPDGLDSCKLVTESTSMFTNLDHEGTWKKEWVKEEQIIALTTQLKREQDKNKVLAKTPAPSAALATNTTTSEGKSVWTVEPWRLEKKGDSITHDGKEHHWCTGDHWSGGEKHNGMYCNHKTAGHDEWRKHVDDKKANRKERRNQHQRDKGNTVPAKPTESKTQMLALSDSLRAALCTHAGVSDDVYNKVWDAACKDSGNE